MVIPGLIEMHCHILPGVDDGSKDTETSVKMLRRLALQGAETVVLTPHYYSDSISLADFTARRNAAFANLQAALPPDAPRLLLGAEVIYESMYDVHVSGHACQEEQKLMLTLTKPKYFLPVHGEYKQLKKHALTAASLGIPTSNILIAENGSNVILSRDEIKLGEPVTAGAVMVDGLGVGDVGNVVLRDRKHLSEDGLVIIVATVDSKTGKVLAGPDLVSRGFVYVRENESLMDGAQSIVENALERCVDEHVRDWNSVKTRVREALSSYIYRRTKRSPMILPILMEV